MLQPKSAITGISPTCSKNLRKAIADSGSLLRQRAICCKFFNGLLRLLRIALYASWMIAKLLLTSCLVAGTVVIHASGLGVVLSHVLHSPARTETHFWPITWLLIRVAWLLIVILMLAIALWALFFWLAKCLPDFESSFYFSAVTYATIGYGDLVLPKEWRMLGPIEGFTGILMFGLSTAFFFIIVSKSVLQRANERSRA